MTPNTKRPILVLLTSYWVTMLGVALVTLAGVSWCFVLTSDLNGHVSNPYIGLLLFIAIPIVFFAGLGLIPIGIFLDRRRLAQPFSDPEVKRVAIRRATVFFAVMTMANLAIGSQLTYRAIEHMETVQFCGQSCHVMKPEFTAHMLEPHAGVACAGCHIAPGATGWLHAKLAGTNQLIAVVFNTFPRPIESAMENNKLVSSADTCEQCHSRQKLVGEKLVVKSMFKDDEANTRTETVLMMKVGGGKFGGIHGAHMGPGVTIRYATAEKKRGEIPWVQYTNSVQGASRTYLVGNPKTENISKLKTFEMQCVDCHNRAAHAFELPERALDRAMARGELPVGLPYLKKAGMELLKAGYAGDDEAGQKIPAGLLAFYRTKYADVAAKRAADIDGAGKTLLAVYRNNVFPDLKVTWGTYSNNLGHTDTPGCFRCHDEGHVTKDMKTITQDCNACHQALAVEETSPEVLKSLGEAERITRFERK